MMKLRFTNDWLREKIASDPDADHQAGDDIGDNMSWNLGFPEIKKVTAAEARGLVEKSLGASIKHNPAMQSVKDYVEAALAALETRHGSGVLVDITGHGHLFDAKMEDSYDVTTASIEVRRSE